MSANWKIESENELKSRVRYATSYTDENEVSDEMLSSIIADAKYKVYIHTGSDAWFSDEGITLALYAYTCMRLKAAVENIHISKYTLGNETVQMTDAKAEDSQQIQQWAEDIRQGLDASDLDNSPRKSIKNTSDYIGNTHVRDYYDRRW